MGTCFAVAPAPAELLGPKRRTTTKKGKGRGGYTEREEIDKEDGGPDYK